MKEINRPLLVGLGASEFYGYTEKRMSNTGTLYLTWENLWSKAFNITEFFGQNNTSLECVDLVQEPSSSCALRLKAGEKLPESNLWNPLDIGIG